MGIVAASGNEADSASFAKILVDFKKQITIDSLMVADSALYNAQNIKLLSEIKWLSRVPLSLVEAKKLVQTTPNSEFIKSQIEGYSYAVKRSTYADVDQRWLLHKYAFQAPTRRLGGLQSVGVPA